MLKGKPVGSGRVSVWDSGMSPVSPSQQRKGTCFDRTVASETLEMRMGSTNTHTSTKLQNLQKLTKRWRSRSCYPSISMSLSSLIPLSTFCHQSGREGETERMREKERERWRDFWLACKLFGQIQEDVESPLIPNLSTFFSSVSIPSSTTFHQSALTHLLP